MLSGRLTHAHPEFLLGPVLHHTTLRCHSTDLIPGVFWPATALLVCHDYVYLWNIAPTQGPYGGVFWLCSPLTLQAKCDPLCSIGQRLHCDNFAEHKYLILIAIEAPAVGCNALCITALLQFVLLHVLNAMHGAAGWGNSPALGSPLGDHGGCGAAAGRRCCCGGSLPGESTMSTAGCCLSITCQLSVKLHTSQSVAFTHAPHVGGTIAQKKAGAASLRGSHGQHSAGSRISPPGTAECI
jgi:hypothetical protein